MTLKKAFDSVIHSVMFYKLCNANISGLFYSAIKNMYSENDIHIKVGNNLSEQVRYILVSGKAIILVQICLSYSSMVSQNVLMHPVIKCSYVISI